jgi:hypothetical protein
VQGAIEANRAGFTGAGFANPENSLGKSIAWRVNAAQLGAYSIQVRYANGGSGPLGGTLFVNNASNGVLTLDTTGGWAKWQSESLPVFLNEGVNTLVLTANGAGGLADIDAISLQGSGITPVACNISPGSSSSSSSSSSAASSSSSSSGAACKSQFLQGGICYEKYFAGIDTQKINLPKYLSNAATYRRGALNTLKEFKSPMWSIQKNGQWSIYFHFQEWKGPVTALAVQNMTREYERIANAWMDTLDAFDSKAPKNVTVKVFGFVFNAGVTADASFYEVYGKYPIVTQWNQADERSPWVVKDKKSGITSDQNWYNIVDFTELAVTGNRTDAGSAVKFSPSNWKGYVHPEGVDMFFTKFWFVIPWDAVAQRQYLKLGGNVRNFATGQLDAGVFTHEMGHCFFHDDIYDNQKYPDNAALEQESVMHSANSIQNFDRVIQRMIWEVQKL